MENIAIQTSQNIAIEQTVASIGERIAAAALDYLFFFIYFMSISVFMGAITQNAPMTMIILALPVFFYHLICETAMNGQSFGKRIIKIKVVKIDGTKATLISYLIRWIFRLVDNTILLGAVSTITIILNGKGQRLGDIVANTTVIRLKEKSINDTIYMNLPEDYSLVFEQISRLSESDIRTAKEVLDFLNESYVSYNAQTIAIKAKQALESKMGIQSDMPNGKFLATVIRDYNYIHSK